jgi:hypothetical protein
MKKNKLWVVTAKNDRYPYFLDALFGTQNQARIYLFTSLHHRFLYKCSEKEIQSKNEYFSFRTRTSSISLKKHAEE